MKRLACLAALLFPAPADAWVATSTAYSPCSAGTIMADGTPVRLGSVASNRHPLGTRIYVTSGGGAAGFYGIRRFTVRDRIGWGSDLDFWSPSCRFAILWGRRTVTYRIGWPYKVGRVGVHRREGL